MVHRSVKLRRVRSRCQQDRRGGDVNSQETFGGETRLGSRRKHDYRWMRTRTLVASHDQVGAGEEHALAVETPVPQFCFRGTRFVLCVLSNYPLQHSIYVSSILSTLITIYILHVASSRSIFCITLFITSLNLTRPKHGTRTTSTRSSRGRSFDTSLPTRSIPY